MSLIVQKFGGTSVGSVERIKRAAAIVAREFKENGNKVAVVVSAMSGVTDQLISLTSQFQLSNQLGRDIEYDAVISSGENVSAGLLALALQELGLKAISWQGWQVPIITDENFTKGRVKEVDPKKLMECIDQGVIPVITGFQGIYNNRIVTLGRGGSDTTAAAVAAALKADRCDIYTDVKGVFTADPRVVSKARKLDKITYSEMLEMASSGAKVLHPRAVEIAWKYGLRMQVLSSLEDEPGTLLVNEDEIMEDNKITGITGSNNICTYLLTGVNSNPLSQSKIFETLKLANVNVDMIVQSYANDNKAQNLTLTIPMSDNEAAAKAISGMNGVLFSEYSSNDNIAKVSITGIGMKSSAGIAQKMFHILADKGINILVISTSDIKISVLIPSEYMELAMRSLHTAFELDIEKTSNEVAQ